MNVKILVISYKMNFLGEALMRTLPRHLGEVIVVHNGKTRDRAGLFDARGAKQIFWEGDDNHGTILDRIFVDGMIPEVTNETDWVVCLDHDLHLIQRRFERAFLAFQEAAAATNRPVVARSRPTDIAGPWVYFWFTVPFFWVRPNAFIGSGLTWTPEVRGSVTYDTGQAMYEKNRDMFELVQHEVGDVGMHFNSYWTTKTGHNQRFLDRIRAHYCMLTTLGYFKPSTDEWNEMSQYPAFDMAVKHRR